MKLLRAANHICCTCVIWSIAVAISDSIRLKGQAGALTVAAGTGTAATTAEIIVVIAVAEGIEESCVSAIAAAAVRNTRTIAAASLKIRTIKSTISQHLIISYNSLDRIPYLKGFEPFMV